MMTVSFRFIDQVIKLCLPALLFACSVAAQALDDQPQPLKMRTLENPPLEFTTASGKVTGIVVDIIREAARRTGRQVDIQVYPWKRVINEVAAGNADAAFNAGKSQERMVWGHFHSTVLIDETFVFFARHPILLS